MERQIKITDIILGSEKNRIYAKARDPITNEVVMETDIGNLLASIYKSNRSPTVDIINKDEVLQTLGSVLVQSHRATFFKG